ncbi:MAG TPA: M56 family metallopeptidase, partial [Planctomycetota bacterium]|nr:M56 family metallopeptidase [Planctomycetota bacterium]
MSLPVASPAASASVSADPAAQRAAAAPATPTANVAADPATVVAEPGAGSRAFGEWLTYLWVAGMGVLLALSVRDRFRGALLVRRAGPGLPAWQRLAARHAKQLRVRTPQVRHTSGLASPALVGALRPVILIPDWMQCEATVEWAIRHELMHVAMRDPWAALVREAGRIVFFFHPAVWFAGRKWEEATELACDRALVNDDAECLDYADRLHSLACRSHGVPMLAHGMYVARSRVGRRIEALLALPAGPARLSRTGAAAIALLFAATLAAGAGAGAMPSDFVFTGSVRDHDGKPVAGALVVASLWAPIDATCIELATANTDAEGRFTLGYDKQDLPFDPSRNDPWNRVMLSAHAQNHGIDWVHQRDLARLDGIELRLPRDYTLKGRLADEDGQPMRGVEVRAIGIRTTKDESLDAWCKSLADGGSLEVLSKQAQVPPGRAPRAVTDETGAFELRGAGAERIVVLQHKGGDAALGRVWMATREIDGALLAKIQRPRMEPVLSSGAMAIAGRTRPVDGVVVDAATGAPVPGADVYAAVMNGIMDLSHELRTRTDDQGRFRILGMPRGGGNQLVIVPRGDEPWFLRDVRVPNPEGIGPIEVRVALNKGVWITGKVVDGATGKPARGLVSYHPHLFNPLVQQVDQFKDRTVDGFRGAIRTAADGTFRIPG